MHHLGKKEKLTNNILKYYLIISQIFELKEQEILNRFKSLEQLGDRKKFL